MDVSRILEKQQRLDARQELHQHPELVESLALRLGQYLPGDVASLGRVVEVLTHPLPSEGWRALRRKGEALLARDVRGEAKADEVDAFLAACELLLEYAEKPRRTPVRVPARQVDALLYRSPQPREGDLTELADLKLVVNLREESDQSQLLCEKLGLDYHCIPVPDQGTPAFDQVLEFLQVVEKRGPALVHCWAGRGRTGLFVACWRLWSGVELEEAIALSDAEALSRGMRDSQRDWVRANAARLPRRAVAPEPPAPA